MVTLRFRPRSDGAKILLFMVESYCSQLIFSHKFYQIPPSEQDRKRLLKFVRWVGKGNIVIMKKSGIP